MGRRVGVCRGIRTKNQVAAEMNKDAPWRQLKGGGGRESPMLFEELGIRERDYQKIGEHLDLDRKRLDYDTFYTFYQDFVVNAVNTAPDGWTRYVAGGASR